MCLLKTSCRRCYVCFLPKLPRSPLCFVSKLRPKMLWRSFFPSGALKEEESCWCGLTNAETDATCGSSKSHTIYVCLFSAKNRRVALYVFPQIHDRRSDGVHSFLLEPKKEMSLVDVDLLKLYTAECYHSLFLKFPTTKASALFLSFSSPKKPGALLMLLFWSLYIAIFFSLSP